MRSRTTSHPTLLCVANFPANTGFAWDFFERLYGRIADRLAASSIRTVVAYPEIESPPRSLSGHAADAVVLDARLGNLRSILSTIGFIVRHRVRAFYSKDRPAWHLAYPLLRIAGVRQIIIYDQTSGLRDPPGAWKRLIKRSLHRIPGSLADRVLTVSDFVARRHVEVGLIPPVRVQRLWNGIEVPELDPDAGGKLREAFDLAADRQVIICVCRATPEKGVHYLFRAFDRIVREVREGRSTPALVYIGDGPHMTELRRLRDSLPSAEHIVMAGYRADAARLVEGADLAVVPSVWQEAFGLAALEPMSRGRPVIATRVGGLQEIVVHEQTGLLVEPGDEEALARAMSRLLSAPDQRRRMGEQGRRRAREHFSAERQVRTLASMLERPFQA